MGKMLTSEKKKKLVGQMDGQTCCKSGEEPNVRQFLSFLSFSSCYGKTCITGSINVAPEC